MKNILFIGIVLVLSISCSKKRNKPNTYEQRLATEIKTEELAKQEAEANLMQNAHSIPDSLPPGFRFQEDRSVNPNKPPEIIDIAGNQENKKIIKLSDLGRKIKYIRIATPPDSTLFIVTPKIYFTNNRIIATTFAATCIYSLNGDFLAMISKSELESHSIPPPPIPKDVPYYSRYKNLPKNLKKLRFESRMPSSGVMDLYPAHPGSQNIYFQYKDLSKKTSTLMKYDIENPSPILSLPGHIENPKDVNCKGEKISSLPYKNKFRYHILNNQLKIGYQSSWNTAKSGISLLLENMQGDTICIFNTSEKISDYDGSVVRNLERGSQYFYRNKFTFRPSLSDTVFRLIPPNRLVPAFLLNFGAHKISMLDALHPKNSIENKWLIKKWLETSDGIYIQYTEGRSSPNNIIKQKIKFFYAIYKKQTKELYHVPVDPLNYVYKIENDIDGGFPIWPENTTMEGKIFFSFEGWELKRHIKSNQFKQSAVPLEKKEQLMQLANSVGDAETIIMIIE